MQIKFYNCPAPKDFDPAMLPENQPAFLSYQPDWDAMTKIVDQHRDIKNMLVIGHGGSITSLYGMYYALQEQATKQVYFLSTVDPDYIAELRHTLKPADTLVVAISKSGETVTQLEALLQFIDFPLLVIAGEKTPLWEIAQRLKAPAMVHPPIGGRFTGLTEVALVPALMAGIDAQGLLQGAAEVYADYEKNNLAWKAASVGWQLEQLHYSDVFLPVYTHALFPLSALIVQLCHESFGKDGRGQTFLAHEAPESQHHTNQRLFGGPKNMYAFFLNAAMPLQDLRLHVPPSLQSVTLRDKDLFMLNKAALGQSLAAELHGTLEDARAQGLPVVHLEITSRNAKEIGACLAFWQLYAVYGACLRRVNPFDQPQVENSKQLSWQERLRHRGLT
jgi:glucose-6-phosphate isomerase